jgi:hypothetical protein
MHAKTVVHRRWTARAILTMGVGLAAWTWAAPASAATDSMTSSVSNLDYR